MKIVITGHTGGLGLAIYNHFICSENSHHVVGLSRSNGYDINDTDKIIEVAETADIFFNNAYSGLAQSELIRGLMNRTRIVTSGSMGADYHHLDNQYYRDKHNIEQCHRSIKKIVDCPMLLLKMGFLQNFPDRYPISYSTVLRAIDFWIIEPRVSVIEFENDRHIYLSKNS
jgi:hypothetical protein